MFRCALCDKMSKNADQRWIPRYSFMYGRFVNMAHCSKCRAKIKKALDIAVIEGADYTDNAVVDYLEKIMEGKL